MFAIEVDVLLAVTSPVDGFMFVHIVRGLILLKFDAAVVSFALNLPFTYIKASFSLLDTHILCQLLDSVCVVKAVTNEPLVAGGIIGASEAMLKVI